MGSGRRISVRAQAALDLGGRADHAFKIGEVEAWAAARGITPLLGVDEAGKGPLAGPVAAAAVILPPRHGLTGLRDSKQLTESEREALFPKIQRVAVAYGVALSDHATIDRIGIQPATYAAMHEAINLALAAVNEDGLATARPALVVVDGKLAIPRLTWPQKTVIKGDDRCYAVAAASILAKVTRDRLMSSLDAEYPGYGFAAHKGYGTDHHRRRLLELGPCPIHRRSFRGTVQEALLLELPERSAAAAPPLVD